MTKRRLQNVALQPAGLGNTAMGRTMIAPLVDGKAPVIRSRRIQAALVCLTLLIGVPAYRFLMQRRLNAALVEAVVQRDSGRFRALLTQGRTLAPWWSAAVSATRPRDRPAAAVTLISTRHPWRAPIRTRRPRRRSLARS